MKAECRDGFWPMTVELEGFVPHGYLDVLGLWTIAVGNLRDTVAEAQRLPLMRADGKPATKAEIAAEHATMKAAFCGVKGAEDAHRKCAWRGVAGKVCLAHQGWRAVSKVVAKPLRLTEEGVRAVVMEQFEAHDLGLQARYRSFEQWPWQAQLATHSMAWACGTGFGAKFPRLRAALLADDFRTAAVECHINESGNPGVIPRNVKTKALYRAAVGELVDPSPFDLSTVAGLQRALSRLGYSPGADDGIAGPKTKEAVKAFQRDRDLHDDGIVGPKTRLELETALRTAA